MPGDDTYLPELNLSEIEALKDGLKYFKVSQLRELSRSLGVRQGKKKAETIENIRAIIDRFLKPFDKVSLVTIIVLTEMLKARPDLPVFASLYRGLETGTVNYQSTLQSISALKSSSVPNYRTHPTNIKAVSKKAPPTRSPFTLVFEPSPFHELIKDLPEFPGVGYGSATRSQILMNITLSPEDRELLKDPSNRVYLRCTNFDKVSVRTCSIEYPDKMELSVNGQTIKESGVRGIKNVPGTARPFDITDHLKQESNSIKLLFIDKNPFMLIGSICKKFSITEVLQKLNMKRIPKEVEIQKIKASHDNTDDDISVGIEKVSLKCPLSYARIRLPVKSEQCDHTGCFDAYSFLALQEQISTWKCPICQKRISAEELRISEYFEDIIKSSKIETEMVMLAEDGGWIEQMQDDDDISETDSSKHMVREPAKDESMIETIVLDSDESDEESAEDPPETALSDDLDDIPIAAAAFRHVPRVISDDDGEGNIEQPTESPHPDKVRGSALSGDSLGDTLLDAPGRSEQPVEMLSDTPAPAAESETTPQNQFQPTQSPSDIPQNEDLTSEAPIGRDTGKEVSNTVVDPPTNDEYRSDYSHMSHYPHASLVPRATSLFGPSSVLLSGPNNQSHRTREEQMTCGSTQIPNRAEPMSSGQIVSLPSLNLMVGEGQDKLSTSLPLRPIQLPSDSVAQVHSNNVRSGIRNGTSFQNFSSRSSSITSPSSGETEAQANTQKKESSTPNHMVRSHRSYNLISNILSEQDRPSTSSTEGQKDLVIAQSTGGNGRTTGNSSAQNLSKNTEIPPTTHQDVPENTGLSSGASQVQLLKEKIRSYKQNQIGDIDGAPEDVFPEPSRNTSGKGAQHVNQPADSAQSSTSPKGLNEIVSTDPNRNGPSKGSKTVVENRDDFVWVDGESNEPPRMAPVAPSQKTLPHTSINNQVIENPTSERNAESSNYSTSKPVQANFSNINPVQKHQNDSDNEEAITPMKKKTKTMGLLGIHLSDDPRDYSISPLNGKVGEMNLNSP
ncbi:E3 SUMO-protein ligase pli1 [Yamadazyma tenuis]|uniref:E3 SUMO-protein ligase pli1 n=1 Tax=Candida tenuis TaxID=2315449 RepID=UPI0027AB2FAB|nr:E3 SUMO-protein ligase pli1 [Yamadazyma tenuis]